MARRNFKDWYDLISEVPHSSGVYEVWSGDVVLYVGQSSNMHRRLHSHTHRSLMLKLGATHIKWTVLKDDLGVRLLLESMLSERYFPVLYREGRYGHYNNLYRRFFWRFFRNYKHPRRWRDGRMGRVGTPAVFDLEIPIKEWRIAGEDAS